MFTSPPARILPRRPPTSRQTLSATCVALSGSVDAARLAAGCVGLGALGIALETPPAATAQWRYFAGTDAERLAALDAALASNAELVLFGRGGYGLSRLLHRIDWRRVAASRKVFCGYSDVTAFSLAALATSGLITLAGPVAAGEFAQTDDRAARTFCETHFLGLLAGDTYHYPPCENDTPLGAETVEGTLWGTNLAMVTHLIGTPFLPHFDDGILLLEDIGESPYRVERMFWQLKHAGVLDHQRAIVLGAFTDCTPAQGMRYPYSMAEAIETLREIAPCPVLTGFPFGHIPGKVTLPIGARATLRISGANYSLSVSDYLTD
ncbi:MAG: LD-carboxypeptidase [Burkholderiales bacterium]|nr:LD-carboxypeptidase [Burkholderiales bacterium]